MASYIRIENRSSESVEVSISSYSNPDGSEAWYTIRADSNDSWSRKGWEAVIFKQPGSNSVRAGVYVPNGEVITFNSFSDIKTAPTCAPATSFLFVSHHAANNGTIVVKNKTCKPVDVFVSKWSNSDGSDSWISLTPGTKLSWIRSFWEIVVFRDPSGSGKRTGVYVPNGARVVFNGFDASWNPVETSSGSAAARPQSIPNPSLAGKAPPVFGAIKPQKPIAVENGSSRPIRVFISNHSLGSEPYTWVILGPGESIVRLRSSWELVAFKDFNTDDTRAGIYVPNDARVTFRSFTEIEMKAGEEVKSPANEGTLGSLVPERVGFSFGPAT